MDDYTVRFPKMKIVLFLAACILFNCLFIVAARGLLATNSDLSRGKTCVEFGCPPGTRICGKKNIKKGQEVTEEIQCTNATHLRIVI